MITRNVLIIVLFSTGTFVSCQQIDRITPTLDELPLEIFHTITQYLPWQDIHALGGVSKNMRAYVKESMHSLKLNTYYMENIIRILDRYKSYSLKRLVIQNPVHNSLLCPQDYFRQLTFLFDTLETLPQLKSLILFNTFCFHSSDSLFNRLPASLEALHVWGGSLGPEQLMALCKTIAGYTTLKVLRLMSQVLIDVPSDVFLSMPFSLQSLELSDNYATTEQLSALLVRIADMPHIMSLSLAGNDASGVPVKLFSLIPPSLIQLDVQRCGLRPQQVRNLLTRIPLTNVEHICLGWNKDLDTMVPEDWALLNSAKSLRQIDLRGNGFSRRPFTINKRIRVLPFALQLD